MQSTAGQQNPLRLFYTSHFLTTWNSRSFEFAAILFLASLFPGTLQPLSIYALVRSAACIIFADLIGRLIDTRPRLTVVTGSIIAGRISVIISSVVFLLLAKVKNTNQSRQGLFVLLVLLACIEKLAATVNLLAIERDWVVVIAQGHEDKLRQLNARMRRLDLICKLVSPLLIALIDQADIQAAICYTLGTNLLSLPLEYLCIARVYQTLPLLQVPRETSAAQADGSATIPNPSSNPATRILYDPPNRASALLIRMVTSQKHISIPNPARQFRAYFSHSACLPSFSLALLYMTVLSFSGQMIAYLTSAKLKPVQIGSIRFASTIFELSATWLAPRLSAHIGPIRAGSWFLNWQLLTIGLSVVYFFTAQQVAPTRFLVSTTGVLIAGTILSRVGLWGFDLCAQLIVQTEVAEDSRGAFSAVESAWQNFFEMGAYVLTIVLSRPSQFRLPVLVSGGAIYTAGIVYAVFVHRRQGHLVHVPKGCLSCRDIRLRRTR